VGTHRRGSYTIEVNIGDEDPVESFAFHVRGDDAAVDVVARLLEDLGLRAIADGEFFSTATARRGFESWREYRDQMIGGSPADD